MRHLNLLSLGGIILCASILGVYFLSKVTAPTPVKSKTPQAYEILNTTLDKHWVQLSRGHDRAPFTFTDLLSHWTLITVGYTSCPDICPMSLAHLRDIYPKLQEVLPNLQVLFLSVDPNRDQFPRLREFVHFFHSDFIAATAEHNILYPLTQALRLNYALTHEEIKNPNDYFVDHSVSMTLVDPQGVARIRFLPNIKGESFLIPLENFLVGLTQLREAT